MRPSRHLPRRAALLQAVVLTAGILCARAETWKFAFFSDTISLSGGLGINTNTLAEIATALAGEKPDDPLNDDKIAEILKQDGIRIARRTVAKYREQLNLPIARLRKKI